ncbi:hypothetical protein SELMODRAFT_402263 [Selaginella moellendorffii]|uniref:Uncharacterized protein n=1 Tax=Selaginella moellendorffii TaxID=88036 RepID=D8QQ37_SELML|nr:hypothetical protein SELMODRAFT_402263 [Selaginella moellendorffii]
MEKIYIDKELNKLIPGNNSPGPIYNSLSSIGKQVESINGNAPCLTFGRDKRWKGRRSTGVPGPGAYEDKVTAFGNQCVSSKQSPEKTDFGKATREQTYKIEEKARFISPGPVRCDERSSIGSQIHSANSTAPKFRFGHERRFRVRLLGSKNKERRWEWGRMQTQEGPISEGSTPGAGRYDCLSSVGKQHESKKGNSPSYSIGIATRQNREKVFLSKEHDKSHFGENSPGPAGNYRVRSSLGHQPNSRNSSASAFKFGSEQRFKPYSDDRPGPGAYDT